MKIQAKEVASLLTTQVEKILNGKTSIDGCVKHIQKKAKVVGAINNLGVRSRLVKKNNFSGEHEVKINGVAIDKSCR